MTIYVDLLFVLNMTINYLLLRGSAAIGGCSVVFWRHLAAAALGGVYAAAAVVPQLAFLQSFFCQSLCAAVMLLLAFGLTKNTLKQGLFFFALSFAFGGAVLLLIQLVEPQCMFLGGRAYYAVSMPAMLLLAGACYAVAAVVLRGFGTHTGSDFVTIELQLEDRLVAMKALRDTGNTLRDPISGQEVLVVDEKTLYRLFPRAEASGTMRQDPAALMTYLAALYPKCRFCLISYRAVGVQAGLLAAVHCTAKIGKRTRPLLAAFSPAPLGDTFDALLGGAA